MKKYLFPIDALVVWCPTWSKNIGRYLNKVSMEVTIHDLKEEAKDEDVESGVEDE